jgi:predicted phosphodiesterase
VFDAINTMKANAKPGSREDFDAFFTVGDNLYPQIEDQPSTSELTKMVELFTTRSAIKNIPIYPVRGNHDCYFNDINAEVKLSAKYPTWKMPSNYYDTKWTVGPNGEQFGVLHIDSCFLLCETIGKNPYSTLFLDKDTMKVQARKCEHKQDAEYMLKANQQMEWIKKMMVSYKQNNKMVWKATTMHHLMFGLKYSEYSSIIEQFLPFFMENGFDVFINGHEHDMSYSNIPSDPLTFFKNYRQFRVSTQDDCHYSQEWFPQNGLEKTARQVAYRKGDKIHQLTFGLSGRSGYEMCSNIL